MPAVILSNVSIYKNIVDTHYQSYCALLSQQTELSTGTDSQTDACKEEMYNTQYAMDCEAAIVVVFSYMTIEAFCNMYLNQYIARQRMENFCFIKKINTTISQLFAESGKTVSKRKAFLYYGADIEKLVEIRNSMVHRYPVRLSLSIKTDDALESTAAVAAHQIEKNYLRRISPNDVEMAATAYATFLTKLKESGADFSKLRFIYE